jgi:hypothetical protein
MGSLNNVGKWHQRLDYAVERVSDHSATPKMCYILANGIELPLCQ